MTDAPDFSEREEAAENATSVPRAELERLGFEPEVTRPDIGIDGWIVHAAVTDERLKSYKALPVGSFAVITGRLFPHPLSLLEDPQAYLAWQNEVGPEEAMRQIEVAARAHMKEHGVRSALYIGEMLDNCGVRLEEFST